MRLLLFTLIYLFVHSQLFAQWTPTTIESGITVNGLIAVNALVVDSNIAFAATNYGVYQSTDSGESWFPSGNGLPLFTNVGTIIQSGNDLFATADTSVYLSTDGGQYWNALPDSGLFGRGVAQLAVKGDTLIARELYLECSTDKGLHWHRIDSGIVMHDVVVFEFTGNNLIVGTFEGLYYSTDYGAQWVPVDTAYIPPAGSFEDGRLHIQCIVRVKDEIFAGTNNGIYVSTDSGATWSTRNTGLPVDSFAVYVTGFAFHDSLLYAEVYDGYYRSTNNGASWVFGNDTPFVTYFSDFVTIGKNTIAGTYKGILLSKDNSATWTTVLSGVYVPYNFTINSLLQDNGSLYAASGSGVLVSTDSGARWKDISNTGINALTKFGSYIITGGEDQGKGKGGIYRTSNSGLTWDTVKIPIPPPYSTETINAVTSMGNVLIAAGVNIGIAVSTDSGTSWRVDSTFTPEDFTSLLVANDFVFAGAGGHLYVSTDTGASWNIALAGRFIYALGGTNQYIYAGTDSGVFRSADNGNHWTVVNNGLGGGYIDIHSIATSGKNIFAATEKALFLSTDNGDNWNIINNDGLRDTSFRTLSAGNGFIYTGTDSTGVWRRPLADLIDAVKMGQGSTPKNFLLQQNYPNPFSGETAISFSLSETDPVTLTVYNSLGVEIKSLSLGRLGAGEHTFALHGDGFTNGIYLYHIRAGKNLLTSKMTVIR